MRGFGAQLRSSEGRRSLQVELNGWLNGLAAVDESERSYPGKAVGVLLELREIGESGMPRKTWGRSHDLDPNGSSFRRPFGRGHPRSRVSLTRNPLLSLLTRPPKWTSYGSCQSPLRRSPRSRVTGNLVPISNSILCPIRAFESNRSVNPRDFVLIMLYVTNQHILCPSSALSLFFIALFRFIAEKKDRKTIQPHDL